METENWILEHKWNDGVECLKGLKRLNNKKWIDLVYDNLDLEWKNFGPYLKWFADGGGDEWFQED